MEKKKKVGKNDKYAQNLLELQKIGVNTDSKSFKKKYEELINKVVAGGAMEDLYGKKCTRQLVEVFVKNVDKSTKSPTKRELTACINAMCINFEESGEEFDRQNELLSISSEVLSLVVLVLLSVKVINILSNGGSTEVDVMDYVDGLGILGCMLLSLILFIIPKTVFWKKYLYFHSKNSVFKIVSCGAFSFGYLMFLWGWKIRNAVFTWSMVGVMIFALVITVFEPLYFYVIRYRWLKKVLKEDLHIKEKEEA